MDTFSLTLNMMVMVMMLMNLTTVRVLMILMMMMFSSCISFLFLPNSLYFGRIVQGYWWMGVPTFLTNFALGSLKLLFT